MSMTSLKFNGFLTVVVANKTLQGRKLNTPVLLYSDLASVGTGVSRESLTRV